jgi:hypothetical protein
MISGIPDSWRYLVNHPRVWVDMIKYALYFLGGWGVVYFRRWKKSHNESIAQGWPSVEGRILSGKVDRIPKTTRFLATLTYTYFVEEYRSGKYTHEFTKESDADDFIRQMNGKSVHIRYKQSNPNISVLEQSVIEQHMLLAPRFG